MVYAHVLNRWGHGVRSPLDALGVDAHDQPRVMPCRPQDRRNRPIGLSWSVRSIRWLKAMGC